MKLKETPEDFIVREIPSFSLTPKGTHAVFKLTKRLWNTEGAVQAIAKKLGIPRKRIGYAGSKDKHAVTEQYISLPRAAKASAERIDIKGINLEFVGYSKAPISLGDLQGNEFEIMVRDCEAEPKAKDSFINYFGEQRFSNNNAEIGKAIVKKDYKKAVELIGLEATGKDYIGALKTIPLKTATLYIHAYQSRLWNKLAEGSEADELPMPGYALGGEEYAELMKEEGITPKDFVIRPWPELSAEGAMRQRVVKIENLKIEKNGEKIYKLEFLLPKSCYATVAVNQLML